MGLFENFRLTKEIVLLFTMSHEYPDVSLYYLTGLFNMSEDIFISYLTVLQGMLSPGLRKCTLLSQSANRIYKSIHGHKERHNRKVETPILEFDESGEKVPVTVTDKEGKVSIKTEKITVPEYRAFVLTQKEIEVKEVLRHFADVGYHDGDKFIKEEEFCKNFAVSQYGKDFIEKDGVNYQRTSRMMFLLEKYYPDMTVEEMKELSTKHYYDIIQAVKTKNTPEIIKESQIAVEEIGDNLDDILKYIMSLPENYSGKLVGVRKFKGAHKLKKCNSEVDGLNEIVKAASNSNAKLVLVG